MFGKPHILSFFLNLFSKLNENMRAHERSWGLIFTDERSLIMFSKTNDSYGLSYIPVQ